jgi:hypothetical protein
MHSLRGNRQAEKSCPVQNSPLLLVCISVTRAWVVPRRPKGMAVTSPRHQSAGGRLSALTSKVQSLLGNSLR